MKRRILRIYPIYWVIALLTLLRLALSHQIFRHDYLAALLLLPSLQYPGGSFILSYSWTMNFEIYFYFVLAIIQLKTIRLAVPTLILLLVSLVTAGAALGIQHPVIILIANPILLEFVFGALIALLYVRIGCHRNIGIFLTALGTAAVIYISSQDLPAVANGLQMVMVDHGVFFRVFTWGVCAALIVGGTVLWSPSMDSLTGRFWVLMGNASYSTYLISALGLEYSSRLFFKLDPPPTLSFANRLAYETFVLTAVLALGFACYIFIEKPMLRYLNKKFLRTSASLPSSAKLRTTC